MEDSLKEELIISSASKVHEDWCVQELKAFYERAKQAREAGATPGEAWQKACFKNGTKRNEIWVDVSFFQGHETLCEKSFTDFESFLAIVKYGGLEVRRFAKRDLTDEEIRNNATSADYKIDTNEENILRPFAKLSSASRKENLEAAIGAFNVYTEMAKAGISIEQMENDPQIKDMIGVAIHTDWLKRNKNHPDDNLKVTYSKLDEWTQQQDLTVFAALLGVVKQNKEKFLIQPVEGFELPNYLEEEKKILGISGKKL